MVCFLVEPKAFKVDVLCQLRARYLLFWSTLRTFASFHVCAWSL